MSEMIFIFTFLLIGSNYQLIQNFTNINQKSLKHMLDIYPKRVQNIAERLNKEIYDIEIDKASLEQLIQNFNDLGIALPASKDSFKELLNKLKKIFYSSPFYFYGNSNIMEFRN
jgi:hypothetical protein